MIRKKTNELEIGRYLTPTDASALQNPKNHCVPILDAFRDPMVSDISYIVMPLLRPFDSPEFGAIGEVIDFVTQVLEVRISLSKCARPNLTMWLGYRLHA